MTFREAVHATPNLGPDAFRHGLQALGADSARVRCANPRKLKGSVDVDAALEPIDRHGHRWDYAVGHEESRQDCIYWVEIHEASDHGTTALLQKLTWLKHWLTPDGRRLADLTKQYVLDFERPHNFAQDLSSRAPTGAGWSGFGRTQVRARIDC